MDTKINFFVFTNIIPEKTSKGVIYITPFGEDYVNIFRSISQYESSVAKIEENDLNRNIFVARNGTFNSSVEFRISEPLMPRDSIFIRSDEPLSKLVKKVKENELDTYDIFGAKSISKIDISDANTVSREMKILFYVMLQFMSAGYHERKNKKKIPDWCVCFSEPILRYFLEYFEIKTESPDIHVADQFITNPQFREMITTQLLKILANYVVNNKMIEVRDVKSWYDISLWLSLKSKF